MYESSDDARMAAFNQLARDEQATAIRRMARESHTETTIANATGLSVEFIKRVLADTAPASAANASANVPALGDDP